MNANESIISSVELDSTPSLGAASSYSSGTKWDVYRDSQYRFITQGMIWQLLVYAV